MPIDGGAAVRPADVAGAFDQNPQRLCAAANLAYGLAIKPMPIPVPGITLDRLGSPMLQFPPNWREAWPTGKKERANRNKDLIARMGAPPTTAQVLDEIDLEIGDALAFAVAANFPSVVRLLRMTKLELAQIKGQRALKGKR
jgi:hypothetical protein